MRRLPERQQREEADRACRCEIEPDKPEPALVGECLREFNVRHAPRLVHSRTGVIVVSDGYDTGEPEILAGALAALRKRARRVVWLNPLLGQAGFEPQSRGMQAALPYLDALLPGADLASISHMLPDLLESLR